ncbi:MAG: hypothetical protein UW30_C0003G0025 [Candidatus Giovannonibacteria bacterium GW2011_GWA2_44_13b]|uniref:Uncharacterized protein n=2 Tax=Candidatus Giovannoniibacteriota TaxID=1752738 RepID=A0A0G1H548_9BACT|nr:MAG: hypothetical protein UW30_C0003G0025 [Candidatus Giovannonibacteria bacterium GW2011_GWA2_44_13b]OGF81494.1 MAG: hypothetical protein A2924_00100 [Candidatus Giovannonibacteria bacterium RIFCSPLOWO2_01_FULL_44_16]
MSVQSEKDPYTRYTELGGIINEKDYESALGREPEIDHKTLQYMKAAENIAKRAGIELKNTENNADPKIKLYAVLRGDQKPSDVEYHHEQMSDQRLFAEAMRMLDDNDALQKLIRAYPNIDF